MGKWSMQVLGPWIRREYDKIPNFEFGLLSELIIFVIYQTKNYNQAKSRKHKIRLNGLSFERAFIVKKKRAHCCNEKHTQKCCKYF